MSKSQLVYILQEKGTGHLKIGISNNPVVRMLAFPERIDAEKSFYIECSRASANKIELILHTLFNEHRIMKQPAEGYTEWFAPTCLEALDRFLEEHRRGLGCSELKPLSALTRKAREPVKMSAMRSKCMQLRRHPIIEELEADQSRQSVSVLAQCERFRDTLVQLTSTGSVLAMDWRPFAEFEDKKILLFLDRYLDPDIARDRHRSAIDLDDPILGGIYLSFEGPGLRSLFSRVVSREGTSWKFDGTVAVLFNVYAANLQHGQLWAMKSFADDLEKCHQIVNNALASVEQITDAAEADHRFGRLDSFCAQACVHFRNGSFWERWSKGFQQDFERSAYAMKEPLSCK